MREQRAAAAANGGAETPSSSATESDPSPPVHFELEGVPDSALPARRAVRQWHHESQEEVAFLRRRVARLREAERAALRALEDCEERHAAIAAAQERHRARQREHERAREQRLAAVALGRLTVQERRAASQERRRGVLEGVRSSRAARTASAREERRLVEAALAQRREDARERAWKRHMAIRNLEKRVREQQRRRQESAPHAAREKQREEIAALLGAREANIGQSAALVTVEAQLMRRLLGLRGHTATALSAISGLVGTPRPHAEGDDSNEDDGNAAAGRLHIPRPPPRTTSRPPSAVSSPRDRTVG